jgi:hypothetical protein
MAAMMDNQKMFVLYKKKIIFDFSSCPASTFRLVSLKSVPI